MIDGVRRNLVSGLLGLVLLSVAVAQDTPNARLGNVMWKAPDPTVWRSETNNGWVIFYAAETDGQWCQLRIAPGQPVNGAFADQFQAVITYDLQGRSVVQHSTPESQASQRGGSAMQEWLIVSEPGGGSTTRVYIAFHPGDRFEWMVLLASSQETIQKWTPQAFALVNTVQFANLVGNLVPDPNAAPAAAPIVTPAAVVAEPQPQAQPQPTGPAPKAPGPQNLPAGQQGLSGLFFWLETWTTGNGLDITYNNLTLRPNGQAFFGCPPGGLEAWDFDQAAQRDPARTGYYSVVGAKLIFAPLDGDQVVFDYGQAANGALMLNGYETIRPGKFPPHYRLNASYEAAGTAGGRGSMAAAIRSYTFRADGTCTMGAYGAIDAGVTGGQAGDEDTGTYDISGNTVTIRHGGGQAEVFTGYPFPDENESPPKHLDIDGWMFKLLP